METPNRTGDSGDLAIQYPLFFIRHLADTWPVCTNSGKTWLLAFTKDETARRYLARFKLDTTEYGVTVIRNSYDMKNWLMRWQELFPPDAMIIFDIVDIHKGPVLEMPLWTFHDKC